MIRKKLGILMVAAILIAGIPPAAATAETVTIDLKAILASNDSNAIDARISDIAAEYQSVFRYSSYQLVSRNNMSLGVGQTRSASLPGSRTMHITLVRVSDNRAHLSLRILKKNRQIFETTAELLNNRSLTVGGPRYQNGYLLFHITSSF